MTLITTGECLSGRRHPPIHDPPLENPWLPAASAKTNAQIIVDRFAAHRDSAVHQENPMIVQGIGENWRPSVARGNKQQQGGDVNEDVGWEDTYALVCNTGVPAFGAWILANTPNTKSIATRKGRRAPHSNGALLSRTSIADFPSRSPDIDPFVPMLPAQDQDDAMSDEFSVLYHRIDVLLNNKLARFGVGVALRKKQHDSRMEMLRDQGRNNFRVSLASCRRAFNLHPPPATSSRLFSPLFLPT